MDNGQKGKNLDQPFFTEGVGNAPGNQNPDIAGSLNSNNYDSENPTKSPDIIIGGNADIGRTALSSVGDPNGPGESQALGEVPPLEAPDSVAGGPTAAGGSESESAPNNPNDYARNAENELNKGEDPAAFYNTIRNYEGPKNE